MTQPCKSLAVEEEPKVFLSKQQGYSVGCLVNF